MQKSRSFLYIISLLIGLTCIANPATANTDSQVTMQMDNLMHKYNIPGAAVLIYNNGTTREYLFGVANNKTQLPVESDTIFEIGSITKTFTSLLLAENVADTHLGLNDKLFEHLENGDTYSNSIKQITLLELATHTSGLPYNAPNLSYNAAANNKNAKLLNGFLRSWHSLYPAGSGELYSNLGFSLLGIALANHEQASISQAISNDILHPLNMNNSFLTIPANKISYYSQGYTAKGSPSRSPNGGLLAGSWAMKVSVNDMAQYLRLAMLDNSMPVKLRKAMQIAQTGYFTYTDKSQIGLAWMIQPLNQIKKQELLRAVPLVPRKTTANQVKLINEPEFIENALIEKTGSTNGFRAYIGVIPEQKIGVIILVNRFIYDSNAVKHAGRELLLNN